jgi:hypothetical protein
LRNSFVLLIAAIIGFGLAGSTATATSPAPTKKKRPVRRTVAARSALATKSAAAKTALAVKATATTSVKAPVKAALALKPTGHWRAPNYADSTEGDNVDGDDLTVRRAAVEALGPLNGSVVVTDAETGRILSIVNQKLAYQSGFQPCSTVKIPVALAALSESIVERDTPLRIYGRTSFNMTTAIAKSNNQYFASLGEKLGFDRMSYYARLFGLGEKAGLDIAQEQPGILPSETPKSGMGMMTSFGDGITITPLEMAALMGAVANGGTPVFCRASSAASISISGFPKSSPACWARSSMEPRAASAPIPTSPSMARPAPAPIRARPRTWAGSDRSAKSANRNWSSS